MTRENAVKNIERLYPADAEHQDTAAIGQELLNRAKREVAGWRCEPTEVLIRYSQLCLQRQREDEQRIIKEYRVQVREYEGSCAGEINNSSISK